MEANESLIGALIELWYRCYSFDHHKERDQWFYITRNYCSYKEPTWEIHHHAYIGKDLLSIADSFPLAQKVLIQYLKENIHEYSLPGDWEEKPRDYWRAIQKDLEELTK